MNSIYEGAESYLKVGQSVIFYPETHRPDGARHETIVRGWQKGAYILLEMNPLPTRSIVFRESADCSMRFLKDGVACSMDATIIDWQVSRKKPTFTVSWPTTVRTAAVRRSERIDLRIPCTIYLEETQFEGTLVDLSVGGCGLLSPRRVEQNAQAVVSMTLPDGVYIDHAPLTVRNVRETNDGRCYLGCMLEGANAITHTNIEFYVTTTLLRARGMTNGKPNILILDPNPQAADELRDALNGAGIEVHTRSNLIDGISCARLRLPDTLLVHHNWDSATALDLCRLLHTSPALSNTPVLVYNAPEDQHAPLTQAGATRCHTGPPSTEAIIAQMSTTGDSPPQPATRGSMAEPN